MKAAKDRAEKYKDPAPQRFHFGKKTDKTGAVRTAPQRLNHSHGQRSEVPGESLLELTSGSQRLVKSRVNFNGLQLCGHMNFAKDVGKAVLGRRLALLGPVGQCAPAHSVQMLERSRAVWAAWRALFLPCKEGAGGGFE